MTQFPIIYPDDGVPGMACVEPRRMACPGSMRTFAVKATGDWDERNHGAEKSRRRKHALAAAGEGVGLAEVNGIDELVSEGFQHGRMYGTVTVRNRGDGCRRTPSWA